MSSVMPFTFNTEDFYVCRAWWYKKAVRQVIRHHCSSENIWHKHQLVVLPKVGTTFNWSRDSQKHYLCISEEGMYELLLSSQQPKAKDFRRHCCNVLFPYVCQQLTSKMEE